MSKPGIATRDVDNWAKQDALSLVEVLVLALARLEVEEAMTQKADAIISLLGLLFFHIDDAPHAMKTAHQSWESEPSPLDPSRPPRSFNQDCNGACWTCLAEHRDRGKRPICPPEELWLAERDMLRRQYRLEDVYCALIKLSELYPSLAQAVWAKYVEPWEPKTEPISRENKDQRDEWAAIGIAFLCNSIEGEVRGFGEKVDTTENEIRRLKARGLSNRRIAKRLHCRPEKVQKVLGAA